MSLCLVELVLKNCGCNYTRCKDVLNLKRCLRTFEVSIPISDRPQITSICATPVPGLTSMEAVSALDLVLTKVNHKMPEVNLFLISVSNNSLSSFVSLFFVTSSPF